MSANRTTRRWTWQICAALAVGLWAGSLPGEAKVSAILSTDVGNEVDDQWAIAYLLVNPEFDVLGIVSAQAPTVSPPAAHTTYLALLDEVENRLKMTSHPPLFEGASLPLVDAKTPRLNAGVDFMVQASKSFSKERRLTVFTIGAATDVASAILKDPSIVDRIVVVAMGFNSWPKGGEEFNVSNDVSAWQVILRSDVPVVVGSGDVCRAHLGLTLDQARDLIGKEGPVGQWLWDEYLAWYYRHVKPMRKDDFSKPWFIWDIITMAYSLGMTSQEIYPRPTLRDDEEFEHLQTGKTITWITSVDEKRLWADFVVKLDAYQRTHSVGQGDGRGVLP
ncbi:MAG: nucleoside hydrolase [Acidobacteria bacterium]|nr:nucleoside hydrolase [Acidobacteriota bacterium]